jgi:hypothetical protein
MHRQYGEPPDTCQAVFFRSRAPGFARAGNLPWSAAREIHGSIGAPPRLRNASRPSTFYLVRPHALPSARPFPSSAAPAQQSTFSPFSFGECRPLGYVLSPRACFERRCDLRDLGRKMTREPGDRSYLKGGEYDEEGNDLSRPCVRHRLHALVQGAEAAAPLHQDRKSRSRTGVRWALHLARQRPLPPAALRRRRRRSGLWKGRFTLRALSSGH